jgi:LPS export ABC transporter protein LptC
MEQHRVRWLNTLPKRERLPAAQPPDERHRQPSRRSDTAVSDTCLPGEALPGAARALLIAAALLAALAGGCSLDYGDAELAESIPEDVPDSVFTDYVFTSARDGRPVYRIYADRARVFHSRHEAELEGVFFREFGAEGEIVTEGTAEEALVNTATDNVRLEGNLRFASSIYEAEITAEKLFWSDEEQRLESRSGTEVTIHRENGTRIRGRGLRIHAPSRTIEFTGPVEGQYVYEEEETDNAKE